MLNQNYIILFHPDAPILENQDVQDVLEQLREDIKGHDSSHLLIVLEQPKYQHIHAYTLSEQANNLNEGSYSEDCHYRPLFSETTKTNTFLIPVHEYHHSVSNDDFVLLTSELALDTLPSAQVNFELIKALVKSNKNYCFSLNGDVLSADAAEKILLENDGKLSDIEAFQECNFHTIYADLTQHSVKRLNQAEYETLKVVMRHFN